RGRQFDFSSLIQAAKFVSKSSKHVKIVVCGEGDQLERFRSAKLPNLLAPGWVDKVKLQVLLSRANLALAPYNEHPSFQISIPNKISEYLAFGLPIVSTLQGATHRL